MNDKVKFYTLEIRVENLKLTDARNLFNSIVKFAEQHQTQASGGYTEQGTAQAKKLEESLEQDYGDSD